MTLNPAILAPGHEQYEHFRLPGRPGRQGESRVQYDYRHTDGDLFSCVAASLEKAREKRDDWLRHPMTDAEYAEAREGVSDVCPWCRSSRVSAQGELAWDAAAELATSPLKCLDCDKHWNEILRPVGYEIIEETD